jgi:hypothetical protein
MKRRCYNAATREYPNYGGRGIAVCSRWRDSFANFMSDIGTPNDGDTLDRIDNNGNYEPTNCRWTTRTVQCRNRRSNAHLSLHGETLTLAEWAIRTGISRGTIWSRIHREKWPVGRALTTPARPHR